MKRSFSQVHFAWLSVVHQALYVQDSFGFKLQSIQKMLPAASIEKDEDVTEKVKEKHRKQLEEFER